MKKRCGAVSVLAFGLTAFVLLSFGGNVPKAVQAQTEDVHPSPVNPSAGPAAADRPPDDSFADIDELLRQVASVRQQREKLEQKEKALIAEIEKKVEEKLRGLRNIREKLKKMGIGDSMR